MEGLATRSYLALFKVPGRLAFCAAGFVARSSGAMVGIGMILMVSMLYGSYGLAGAIGATNALAWAAGNTVLARLVDRYGQNRVMVPATIISAASLVGLIVAAWFRVPVAVLFIPSAISGLTGGSPGAMVRARWNHALAEDAQLHAAFALESTLDEVTYIVGPMVATVLATAVHPTAGLITPVVLSVVGGLWFYQGLRASQPPVRLLSVAESPSEQPEAASDALDAPKDVTRFGQTADRFALAFGGMLPVVFVSLLFGGTFGAIDISVVAATKFMGSPALAGVVLATMSLGSALAGLTYGARVWKSPLARRFVIGVVVYAVALAFLLTAYSVVALVIVGFFSGLAIAPTFTNANTLVQTLVPQHRLTEGLAWVGTSIGLGAAVGSAVAGRLIDDFGYRAGFITAVAFVVVAVMMALAGVRTLSRHSGVAGFSREAA